MHSQRRRPLWLTVLVLVACLALVYWNGGRHNSEIGQAGPAPAAPGIGVPDIVGPENVGPENVAPEKAVVENGPAKSRGAADRPARVMVNDVVIRDRDGRVVYRGAIDLTLTLERIAAGRRLRQFPHDGTTFQNREGRLPRKPAGHYQEYVHPTQNLAGPGPQRLIVGQSGEVFYTADHYRSFRKIR